VVGGYGFLGRHLLHTLIKNHSATVITRRAPIDSPVGVNYYLSNSLQETDFKELARSHDLVVYMASSSVPSSGSITNELHDNVLFTTDLILKFASYNSSLKVIYLSSGGQIYGNSYDRKIKESDPREPVSAYGFGKLMVENSLEFLARTRGLKTTILRVSNPIGVWQTSSNQGIVNVSYNALINNRVLTIFGDGSELRDYIDADMVANIILRLSEREYGFEVFNLGSGVGTTLLELLQDIESIVGKTLQKNFTSRRNVDPKSAVLDVSKLENELDISLKTPVRKILEKTLSAKNKLAV